MDRPFVILTGTKRDFVVHEARTFGPFPSGERAQQLLRQKDYAPVSSTGLLWNHPASGRWARIEMVLPETDLL